jgi:hypothetical protein
MTTAFQYIFDRAETLGINRRAVTAQTTARDGTTRAVSRGGQIWRFDVKLPDGIRWTELRPYIEGSDFADRYTVGTVALSNAGYTSWLNNYQGTANNITGFAATWTQGANSITLTASPTNTGAYHFRAGDIIQLGTTGRVYSVRADVASGATTVNLNRPVIDASGSGSLRIAQNVTWQVICTEMPTWNLFARDQVAWSGSFVFYEYML